jgi:hypothetical protein
MFSLSTPKNKSAAQESLTSAWRLQCYRSKGVLRA